MAQFQGGPTIYGAPAAKSAIAVGAVDWSTPQSPEPATSLGGPLPYFFDANGNRLAVPEIRNKPDVAGPDNVTISTKGIDAGKFVKSASNPTPAQTLPAGFNMTQKLHAKTYPADTLEDAPFTTTEHVRRLVEKDGKIQFEIAAGKGSELMDYVGPAVFRNAKADKTTVAASPPKPAKGQWAQNELQVTVDGFGKDPKPTYSIQGEKLGCSVDGSGLVKIGSTAGTITVRAGSATNYDEVKITITAAPTPAVDGGGEKKLDTPGLDAGDDTPEPL